MSVKPYAHGVGVKPSPWHDGGFHLYQTGPLLKKSYSASVDPNLLRGSHGIISVDPVTRRKIFKGTLERVQTDESYRASVASSYSTLMKRKSEKDLPTTPWRGTRPGLPHALGVFSYVKSLVPPPRPQTAPASMKRSASEAIASQWIAGPWKDCGPCGGLYDPFPKVRRPESAGVGSRSKSRSRSEPPMSR